MKSFICIIISICLLGCSNLTDSPLSYLQTNQEATPTPASIASVKPVSLHEQIEVLARQLFDTSNYFDISRPVIIGTFVPADTLNEDPNNSLKAHGLQLQESFMTYATQAGLKVIEFKALSEVVLMRSTDKTLSRELPQLNNRVKADYLLTGTYTQQQGNLLVNVKLINLLDKNLIAAATDTISLRTMWGHTKVTMQGDKLYRGEY